MFEPEERVDVVCVEGELAAGGAGFEVEYGGLGDGMVAALADGKRGGGGGVVVIGIAGGGGEGEGLEGGEEVGADVGVIGRLRGGFGRGVTDVPVTFEAHETLHPVEGVSDYALVGHGVLEIPPSSVGFWEGVAEASHPFNELFRIVFFADEEYGVPDDFDIKAECFVYATSEAEEVAERTAAGEEINIQRGIFGFLF